MQTRKTLGRFSKWTAIVAITAATAGCAGGPMTTREKGAGIGAVGGAAAGGLIGSAFGRFSKTNASSNKIDTRPSAINGRNIN